MPYELSRRLGAGPPLCDDAMGTLLYARGVSVDACFDALNMNNPRVIQSIHADYIAPGVDWMAQELVRAVRRRYAGAYLMPSFGRFEVVAEVLDAIR